MMREKAWKTAISSVQGERKSSSSRARPCASRLRALRRQHLLPVALGFGVGVDAADRQMLHGAMQRLGEMRGRVGGGEMNRQPATRQFDGDGRRQRRLADAALAHQHDQPMAVGGDVVHQFRQARRVQLDRLSARRFQLGRGFDEELAQSVKADEIEGLQRHIIAGQGAKRVGHGGQGRLLACIDGGGERIERRLFLRQKAVDDEELLIEADRRQFPMGARRFAQGGILGAGDEDRGGCAVRPPSASTAA